MFSFSENLDFLDYRTCLRRIEEDHKDFRDVYEGRVRKELQKFINNGKMFRLRSKGGAIPMTVPRIDIPHIVFGKSDDGIGRGPGKPGDVIGRDDDGEGKGHKPGEGHQDGVTIQIDLEAIVKFLQHDLQLPNLKPKSNPIFEEEKIKYNSISLSGPEALRHTKRTILQALKRTCATGEIDLTHQPPGYAQPIRLIKPINSDKRYRQYRVITKPTSNAVLFFARDGSGSMDQQRCDIVSDMAWWIDVWVRHFYERVERCYIWHDTIAQEVDEKKFYNYRYGGGTTCSSALKFILKQFNHRFPPDRWNIYVFYFTDGDNMGDDNKVFTSLVQEKLAPLINFIGITQIMPWSPEGSLKHYLDTHINLSCEVFRTTDITGQNGSYHQLSEDERGLALKKAIVDLLGTQKVKEKSA